MAIAIWTLLAAMLLLITGPGLPRVAGGRPLEPAADAAAAAADAVRDLVKSLPEFGKLGSSLRMYSGYLNVSGDSGADRQVFYSFTESEREPRKDPLVLWLQGGPGCSPVGSGGFKLLGPFFFRPNFENTNSQKLMRNDDSWTKVANLLFIDTPLFTGFSRSSDNVTDRFWGDENTTALHLSSLLSFYDRFPEFRGRPLHVAGHSYAGHYIPLLAEAILEYNSGLSSSESNKKLDLQGYAVGNPWTDPVLDNAGAVEVWYSEGMIQQDTYEGLKQHCNMSAVVLWRTDGESGVEGQCATFRDAALKEMGGYDGYGMSAPKCLLGADGRPLERQPRGREVPSATFDPCAPQRLKAYFNRADVQEALHAIPPGEAPLPWAACNSRGITYSYDSLATSMLPVHRKLLDAGLRALVFSGDSDAVVPTRSTRSWVESLSLPAAGDFRPWTDASTNETAGYVTPYQGLTLATVHGAGHHVSYFKPRQALQLISAWLDGRLP